MEVSKIKKHAEANTHSGLRVDSTHKANVRLLNALQVFLVQVSIPIVHLPLDVRACVSIVASDQHDHLLSYAWNPFNAVAFSGADIATALRQYLLELQ